MKTLLLMLLAGGASANPLLITGGYFGLSQIGVGWQLFGDDFTARGVAIDYFTQHCPACPAPFQLVNPLLVPIRAASGVLTFGGSSYELPPDITLGPPVVPYAYGSVLLTPNGILPTVAGAGAYDVPFDVGGAFCVTDDPHVSPPLPPNPACFTLIGTAIAHYTVIQANTPDYFFQPVPTIEILAPVPEPGTWLMGIPLLIGFLYAAKVRSSGISAPQMLKSLNCQ